MAMTAKAKLLLRELKTMKADLAFAKERCAQLEEENKVLRECHEKGVGPEDDELVCMFISISTKVHDKARGIIIVSCMCVHSMCKILLIHQAGSPFHKIGLVFLSDTHRYIGYLEILANNFYTTFKWCPLDKWLCLILFRAIQGGLHFMNDNADILHM